MPLYLIKLLILITIMLRICLSFFLEKHGIVIILYFFTHTGWVLGVNFNSWKLERMDYLTSNLVRVLSDWNKFTDANI